MILRKPYAFFIKMFKPIHLILTCLIFYLIYLDNKILKFLTEYIYSSNNVIGANITEQLVNNLLYIIPIIIIIMSILILGIMFKKKKAIVFYLFNILVFIVVIIINLYAANFLKILEESIVAIKSVKLIHDLVFINMGIEIICFIIFAIRGIGINFKKFDFDSDLSKINISESDKEEFEINIEFDANESKRKLKNKFRNIKYFYVENRFIINICLIILFFVMVISTCFIIAKTNNQKKEGVIYSTNIFNFAVNSTTILDVDYKGKKINDKEFIIVDVKFQSNFDGKSLNLNDFRLNIGEATFKPTTEYSELFVDLGIPYDEENLTSEYKNYIFIFEIPEKFKNSEMFFKYNDVENAVSIKIQPKALSRKEINESKKIKEKISFEESLGKISFKINKYEIRDKFLIEYNYCVKKGDCLKSKEYLKPSLNKNFDKNILRLDVEYEEDTDLDIDSFYKFLSKFGYINYKLNGKWYSQVSGFEEIESNKLKENNTSYIGINSEIINASNIKLVFNIRDSKYEYIIK